MGFNMKKIHLQIPLEGALAENFEGLFLKTGMKSQADYVRLLISEEHMRQAKET
jgi:hypothetical protein